MIDPPLRGQLLDSTTLEITIIGNQVWPVGP